MDLPFEDDNLEVLTSSIYYLAKAQGNISKLAKNAGIGRQNLYKIFNNQQEPKLITINKILKSLGYKLSALPIENQQIA